MTNHAQICFSQVGDKSSMRDILVNRTGAMITSDDMAARNEGEGCVGQESRHQELCYNERAK